MGLCSPPPVLKMSIASWLFYMDGLPELVTCTRQRELMEGKNRPKRRRKENIFTLCWFLRWGVVVVILINDQHHIDKIHHDGLCKCNRQYQYLAFLIDLVSNPLSKRPLHWTGNWTSKVVAKCSPNLSWYILTCAANTGRGPTQPRCLI